MDTLTAEAMRIAVNAAPVLRVVGVTAGYGDQPVLREASLEVELGEWMALLGPNGSGKSTLLYCIAAMLRPAAGEIEVCGYALARDARIAKRLLGYGCAPERLPGLLTGRQCLEVYAAAKGVREIDAHVLDLMKTFALEPLLDQFVDTYSLGTRQKLAALLALIGAPQLIVLDEAFNGLDPASGRALKRHLRALIEARRASVLLATHALDVVERYADRAALLLCGRIAHIWSASELSGIRSSAGGLEEAISGTSAAYLAALGTSHQGRG
ncbi:MAG TPA: ABC transporter ATP-binding protein [Steroidobacteraceae bacterium]|nr:ABC transporter ATP-binding protein [Steroidobacteraceae bacterium]